MHAARGRAAPHQAVGALARLGERAAPFISARVAVVLDRAVIVADLHEAHEQLDVAAESFGVFMAGPSKTADIEQSLVLGAHGPTEFTGALVGRQ